MTLVPESEAGHLRSSLTQGLNGSGEECIRPLLKAMLYTREDCTNACMKGVSLNTRPRLKVSQKREDAINHALKMHARSTEALSIKFMLNPIQMSWRQSRLNQLLRLSWSIVSCWRLYVWICVTLRTFALSACSTHLRAEAADDVEDHRYVEVNAQHVDQVDCEDGLVEVEVGEAHKMQILLEVRSVRSSLRKAFFSAAVGNRFKLF